MYGTRRPLDMFSDEDIRTEHSALSRPTDETDCRWLDLPDYERWHELDLEMLRRGLQRPVTSPRLKTPLQDMLCQGAPVMLSTGLSSGKTTP